jgi:hypothetical protein
MADNTQLSTLDLEKLVPSDPVVPFDIVPFLFMEFVLKEETFRRQVAELDWENYRGKMPAVFCSNDAIIPSWAFMLIVTEAARNGVSARVGTAEAVYEQVFIEKINQYDFSEFKAKRVLVKGCSLKKVPVSVYAAASVRLASIARRVMYGEACSFVPVFKGSREEQADSAVLS